MELYLPYIAAAAIALAAGCFHGFAGFGTGLMMAPLLTALFPATVAIPTILLLAFSSCIRLLPAIRKDVEVRRVVSLAIPAILCVPVGVLALAILEPEVVRRVVSGIVLALVVALALGLRFRGARRLRVLIPAGAISGMLTGVGGVGGPPIVLTFLSLDEPPQVTRANLIAYFASTDIVAITLMFVSGVSAIAEVLPLLGVSAPFYVAGLYFGVRAFSPENQPKYRKIALSFLAAIALSGLLWSR